MLNIKNMSEHSNQYCDAFNEEKREIKRQRHVRSCWQRLINVGTGLGMLKNHREYIFRAFQTAVKHIRRIKLPFSVKRK